MGKVFSDIDIVCVCPVKNEAWIISFFCNMASAWADHIVVLDQGSTDGTVEIALETPEVIIVDNPSKEFNEGQRQEILIDEARKLGSKQLLIVALDADEFLDPDFPSNRERNIITSSAPGTVFQFSWMLVRSDGESAYEIREVPFAYLDDGAHHHPRDIHSVRVPTPAGCSWHYLPDTANFHLQLINSERQLQKVRWYQALEIHGRGQDPVTTFRQYHTDVSTGEQAKTPVRPEISALIKDIPITVDIFPWWYNDIMRWLTSDTGNRLKWADIWDVSWQDFANGSVVLPSPNMLHHLFIKWLRLTQKHRRQLPVRVVDKLFRSMFLFWGPFKANING